MEDLLCEVYSMIECLTGKLSEDIHSGIETFADLDEAGELADILKDLSEAHKNLLESKYYEEVIEAMETGKEVPMKTTITRYSTTE